VNFGSRGVTAGALLPGCTHRRTGATGRRPAWLGGQSELGAAASRKAVYGGICVLVTYLLIVVVVVVVVVVLVFIEDDVLVACLNLVVAVVVQHKNSINFVVFRHNELRDVLQAVRQGLTNVLLHLNVEELSVIHSHTTIIRFFPSFSLTKYCSGIMTIFPAISRTMSAWLIKAHL